MTIHAWWAAFGEATTVDDVAPGLARSFAEAVLAGIPATTFVEIKEDKATSYVGVHVEIDVERPQDLAHPIRAHEPIGILFPSLQGRPAVLALRNDFPHTMHQNGVPEGMPFSLCVDDRPWSEARLTYTPTELSRLVQLWLAKAARGELHDPAQPPDPLFYDADMSLVLPRSVFEAGSTISEFAGFVRADNQGLVFALPSNEGRLGGVGLTVMAFALPPQIMTSIRRLPRTLESLAAELAPTGLKLLDEIKERLKAWTGIAADGARRMDGRLAIIVGLPVTTEGGRGADDFRAFITANTAGEIGVLLGVLHANNSNVGKGYVRAFPEAPIAGVSLPVAPAQVHFAFDRDLAATIAGTETTDRRKVVLIGAGSLGSQLAMDLARQGAFEWTVVDGDALLPHNMARHALLADEIGAPKANALARQVSALLNEPQSAIVASVLTPNADQQTALDAAYAAASIIVDASASVGVARHLSDLPFAARRVCAFFNPSGTAVVLLTEDARRNVTLRDLEAQYHRLLLTEPSLAKHLDVSQGGVRYSGSCRSLTNKIPATRAALLSALAAGGITEDLASDSAKLTIWTLGERGSVKVVQREGEPVYRFTVGNWQVSYDRGFLVQLAALRDLRLPNETGGAFVGIADWSRSSLHLAHAFPEPEDSVSSRTRFERGVVGLAKSIDDVARRSMHQVRYLGEWHSHPRYASARPSETDIAQLAYLGAELAADGLPGLMAIAAHCGEFSLLSFDPTRSR
ncbi:integrative and conjugative element protein, VC0181 family [Bradyrhizobium sp. Rc3b]|uniref:ThiF family adenylyltransferase n=1 Tax=Bradyrhizobium sp. Rc3b TaxID=1855322 RepID=UPI0008E861CA|nr:ThiF family adenylyltransferase [Bradyrhizobium sp. Rc3b]SFN37991.1 integrative and conjugative element protein, VC0181 family [Bradyrhizobium sp. Rc3b]